MMVETILLRALASSLVLASGSFDKRATTKKTKDKYSHHNNYPVGTLC